MKYYYLDGEKTVGPVAEPVLRELLERGVLRDQSPVRAEDAGQWGVCADFLRNDFYGGGREEPLFYYYHGDEVKGPSAMGAIQSQAAAHGLDPETLMIVPLGATEWMPLAPYLRSQSAGVASQGPPPLPQFGAPPAPPLMSWLGESGMKKLAEISNNPFVLGAKGKASESAGLAWRFVSRIIKSDFTLVSAAPDEREILEKTGDMTKSALAQDYAAWRRALMMVALVLFGTTTLYGLKDLWDILTDRLPFLFKVWYLAYFATQALALVMLVFALIKWTSMTGSRLLSRAAWCLQFFGPILLLLIPLRLLDVQPDVAAMIGVFFALTLLVKIFGLFSGLVRSALSLKTLLPQGRFTAWVVGAVSPFASLFMCLAMLLAIQIGSPSIALGFIALTVGTLLPMIFAGELAKPCDEKAASIVVARARRLQGGALLAGIVFLSYYLLEVVRVDIGFMDLLRFICGFLANLLLVTLVAADVIIGLTKKAIEQSRHAEGTESNRELEQRLAALK